ncbi:heme NO-binding domain-containing protein [Vibrio panuliri]|uniref:Guanylate cyclase n=1 Tax=Vibrio panuliri TaxID=1381081 RepID=A0A1Q9HIV5_9VIBR|nr:heme NO-binding domain-containing protein [Vibrio panuliri]KAB1454198.1 guanylate cyclase [Vibrio panuliri]OLQ90268.1 guanylate cyclase [Vibrio panuliri]OLQ96000.1 guanylate cyclase [Vibrio panuliri]
MKGIIFTEFMDLVEDKFGLEVLDQILEHANDDGIYTAVGSYDHRDLVKLIIKLSEITQLPPETLQQVFGQSVFNNLYATLPDSASLGECRNCFQFVRLVEDYIHIEVKKLYPEANPPKFEFISESETELVFDYKSARCMSHVCLGLVQGCADHFDEKLEVKMDQQSSDNSHVRFHLSLVD